MKLNHYLAGVLAAASVAFALPAAANQDGAGAGATQESRPERGMRMLRGLNLSAEQRSQASKIFEEQAPAFRERAAAARAANEALRKAAVDPNADSGRIRALADAAGKAHAEAAMVRAETLRRVSGILTPEQRQRLGEERGERRDGRERRDGAR